ncbi:integral membrane protein [Penicillium digitatum]|uniref:Integral membrane protein n=1 Tax=Penicillium digitatum TaxID=36651 RepID=A0A7T7BPN5_PENDI|nr:integral membrane protein [Penicillium digitatum]
MSQLAINLTGIFSILGVLCLISLALQLVARIQKRVRFGIDDYLSLVSMVLLVAMLFELILYWDHSIEETGLDAQKFIIVNQANNVLMDLVILVLQIPVIWNLRRVWQDKLALNGVFALGAFVCFASINRIVALFWIILTDPAFTVYQTTL